MSQRLMLIVQLLLGFALVALSIVWPQGQGAPSPAPFGHPMAAPERTIVIGVQPVAPIRGAQTAPAEPEPGDPGSDEQP